MEIQKIQKCMFLNLKLPKFCLKWLIFPRFFLASYSSRGIPRIEIPHSSFLIEGLTSLVAMQCDHDETCPGDCYSRECCQHGGGDCGGYRVHHFRWWNITIKQEYSYIVREWLDLAGLKMLACYVIVFLKWKSTDPAECWHQLQSLLSR